MFRIGDFSRLTRVSVKTLHHYDEIGLFKPAHVDRFTGYRYYSMEQMPRLNRILALREIGFSLEQIGAVLDDHLSADGLYTLLCSRQTELEREMTEVKEKLARLSLHLRQLEQEGSMAEVQVVLKKVDEVFVAGARETVKDQSMMRERCMALDSDVRAYISKHGLKIAGPSLALYHDSSTEGIDVAMAYFIEKPAAAPKADGGAHAHALPAQTMASAVYHGSYDGFEAVRDVYSAIGKWIEANGYKIVGAIREIYLQPPNFKTNERIGVMEIQFPVEKA